MNKNRYILLKASKNFAPNPNRKEKGFFDKMKEYFE